MTKLLFSVPLLWTRYSRLNSSSPHLPDVLLLCSSFHQNGENTCLPFNCGSCVCLALDLNTSISEPVSSFNYKRHHVFQLASALMPKPWGELSLSSYCPFSPGPRINTCAANQRSTHGKEPSPVWCSAPCGAQLTPCQPTGVGVIVLLLYATWMWWWVINEAIAK